MALFNNRSILWKKSAEMEKIDDKFIESIKRMKKHVNIVSGHVAKTTYAEQFDQLCTVSIFDNHSFFRDKFIFIEIV